MDDLSTENSQRDKNKQKSMFVLNQGAFMGLVLSAAFWFVQLANLETSFVNDLLSWALIVGFIHVSMVRYRRNYQEGWLTYGQGVWLGTRIGMLAGIVFGAWMFLYMKVINPEYVNEMIVQMQEAYLASGMDEETVANMEGMFELFTNPFLMIFSGVFGVGLYALVFSLIIAIFQRRKPADPFSNAMKNIE